MTPAVTKRRNSSLQSHGLLHQLATIAAAPEERYLPFPLTDIQQAYWLGRQEGVELGGVTTHRYCEIECEGLGPERLSSAKSVQRDGCLSLVGGARREGDRAGGEFFELDGHSLLASRVVSPLRSRSGVEIALRAVFDNPTLAAMGRFLANYREGGSDRSESSDLLREEALL
jgi:hypothetical protein